MAKDKGNSAMYGAHASSKMGKTKGKLTVKSPASGSLTKKK